MINCGKPAPDIHTYLGSLCLRPKINNGANLDPQRRVGIPGDVTELNFLWWR